MLSRARIAFVRQIWKSPFHNAFPDIIYYNERFFVAFRQAEKHYLSENSKILIITSSDLIKWSLVQEITVPGQDLRDPKFSLMPDGKLMLNTGSLENSKGASLGSFVAFSKTGFSWTSLQQVMERGDWLWRLTWEGKAGYGISYRFSNPNDIDQEWLADLVTTKDGISFEKVAKLPVKGHPSEGTVRFDPQGVMWILIRRDRGPAAKGGLAARAGLLKAKPPYKKFDYLPLNCYLGGPNFVFSGGEWLVAGRFLAVNPFGVFERMGVAMLSKGKIESPIFLPGVGDLGYPGIVFHEGRLLLCYYASPEKRSSIFLAALDL